MCTHTRQVEHQRCSRIGRVQKIQKIVRKNTIFNEHPVGEKTKTQGMKDNVFFRDATHLKENTSKAGDALCVCVRPKISLPNL